MAVDRRPRRKTERNLNILKDYNKGMPIVEMVRKYRITSTRIYHILRRFEKESEHED